MCSIMGISSKSVPYAKVRDQFDKTISRGPDMSRIIETKSGYLCFHRLAIMGLHPEGMQPFEMDGDYVVCNGELYNFRSTKEKLEKITTSSASLIASFCCPYTANTALACFLCSMLSLP